VEIGVENEGQGKEGDRRERGGGQEGGDVVDEKRKRIRK